jgi:predicted phage terminase large subunit-like protein
MVALYEAHRVYHRRGASWLREWEDEHLAFPNAAHDDQVDTGAYAAIELQRQKGGRGTELGGLANKQL